MPKTAKNKDISEKRPRKIAQVKRFPNTVSNESQRKFGEHILRQNAVDMGMYKVFATHNKKNPWRAESNDGLNIAFGQSKDHALNNLLLGIANRKD